MGGGVDMSLIWEEMIAAGTILLAIATFVAVFREPVSNRLKAPKVIVEPSNATYSHDNNGSQCIC